jgi:hypothetical protein
MGLIKTLIKALTTDGEGLWNYNLKKLDIYNDVERLNELIDIMVNIHDGKYPNYEAVVKTGELDSLGEKDAYYDFKIDDVPIFHSADKGLNMNYLPFYVAELTGLVDKDSFVCVFSMIQASYIGHSGHKLRFEEEKAIKLSDLMVRLTFYLEDFDKPEYPLPEFDSTFFKKISNIEWENKRAKELDETIYYGCLFDICVERGLPTIFDRTFEHANPYFMACNAIRNGRDTVNCEDVVVGYLTNFKILLTDIRIYVWKYYDQDFDPRETRWWKKIIE